MLFWVGSLNEKNILQAFTSPKEVENPENIDEKLKMLKHALEKILHALNWGQDDVSDKVKNITKIMTGKD